jgi:molecular chaperone GrpE
VHDSAKAADARGATPGPRVPGAGIPAEELPEEEIPEALPEEDSKGEMSYADAAVRPDERHPCAGTKPAHGGRGAAGGQLRVELDFDELAARAEKADEYLELAQRARADFENYKRRSDRDVAAAQERGIARLAKELLPAIDNLDRAVQAALAEAMDGEDSASMPDSQLVSGIRLVQADVTAALARVGIESFSPVGEAFDPHYHEAVAQAPFEGAIPGTVAEVYQPGYRIGETVLRPARVVVAG